MARGGAVLLNPHLSRDYHRLRNQELPVVCCQHVRGGEANSNYISGCSPALYEPRAVILSPNYAIGLNVSRMLYRAISAPPTIAPSATSLRMCIAILECIAARTSLFSTRENHIRGAVPPLKPQTGTYRYDYPIHWLSPVFISDQSVEPSIPNSPLLLFQGHASFASRQYRCVGEIRC